jgi:hypothetical protein
VSQPARQAISTASTVHQLRRLRSIRSYSIAVPYMIRIRILPPPRFRRTHARARDRLVSCHRLKHQQDYSAGIPLGAPLGHASTDTDLRLQRYRIQPNDEVPDLCLTSTAASARGKGYSIRLDTQRGYDGVLSLPAGPSCLRAYQVFDSRYAAQLLSHQERHARSADTARPRLSASNCKSKARNAEVSSARRFGCSETNKGR